MNNLPFALWMLFFPLASSADCYVSELAGTHNPHGPLQGGATVIMFAFYLGIAALLYRRAA